VPLWPVHRAVHCRAVIAAAASVTVTACGAAQPFPAPASPADRAAARTASAAPSAASYTGPVAPLTGLPAANTAAAARPAVALAVAGADPHGLSHADVVYEEISHPVRYIAVFQSQLPPAVGPITSTLPTDGMTLSVLHPLIGYSGGTPSFIQVLDATKVIDAGYPAHASLYRSGPAGLTAAPGRMVRAARDTAPPELFPYRGASLGGGDELASRGVWHPATVTVRIPGEPTQVWSFEGRRDRWLLTRGGPRLRMANVIVQTVDFKTVYLSRRYHLTTGSARVIGKGSAVVLSGGQDAGAQPGQGGLAASGTWRKPGLRDVTNYLDGNGLPMYLEPGPTWVVLAPRGTRVLTSGAPR
jgi:DUF3048 family protein